MKTKIQKAKKAPVEVLDAEYRLNSACIRGLDANEIENLRKELKEIADKFNWKLEGED